MRRAADCPSWLLVIARRLFRRRWPSERLRSAEAEGDLRELWKVRAGEGRRDLRRAFLRDLFGLLRQRQTSTRTSRVRWSAGLQATTFAVGHDLRHAVRLMRRQPLFTALTIVTLTLGIAGSTTIFSAIERLLLRPLPYPSPAAIVAIENPLFSFAGNGMASHPAILKLGVFTAAGLYDEGGLNLDDTAAAVRVRAAAAEPGMFEALGVPARLGRIYNAAEGRDASAPVAVISDGLWRRQFGARLDILEQTISLNRRRFRITGVMPPGFTFPEATEVWIPPFSDRQLTGDAFAPSVLARLSPGVSTATAEAALAQFMRDRGRASDDEPMRVRTLQHELTRRVRPILLLLGVSVSLVLLVSCSNVAGLLLSRVTGRQSEFVLRRALGGSRWRLTRQLLIESLLLSLIAGVFGVAAAAALIRAIPLLLDQPIADVDLIGMDAPFLLIALALSTVTAVLFGLGPGLAAGARPAAEVLRASATATTGRFGRWFRHGLVAAQVAAALVLLVVMGSTVERLMQLSRIDLGFDGRDVVGLEVTLPIAAYKEPREAIAFYERAAEHLQAIPGVLQVAATGRLPGDRTIGVGMALREAGTPAPTPEIEPVFASMLTASPQYFDVLGVPLRAGRPFGAADRAGTPPVVILSESAALALWPEVRLAVGKFVQVGRGGVERAEVVGVVADVLIHGPDVKTRQSRQLYRPLLQSPPYGTMAFAVHSRIGPNGIAAPLRAAIATADPNLPVARITAMSDVIARFLSTQRLSMMLMSSFAGIALVMAIVGLYGVLASLVAQRTREIGIRLALGADGGRLRRSIVFAGLKLTAAGIVIGALASGTASSLISRFVPMLDAPSWWSIGAQSLVLLGAAVLAAWLPARRASGVDPIRALRAD